MRLILQSLLGVLLGSVFIVGFPAFAQTPDGSTPAVEGICDPLKADGITKGLFGLCVAYCEAQDFASEDVPLTDAEIEALHVADAPSGRILDNYNTRRGATDPEMPCVVRKPTGCPCFDQDMVNRIDGIHDTTYSSNLETRCDTYGTQVYEVWEVGSIFNGPPYIQYAWVLGTSQCNYYHGLYPADDRIITDLTPDEFIQCQALVGTAPVCSQ